MAKKIKVRATAHKILNGLMESQLLKRFYNYYRKVLWSVFGVALGISGCYLIHLTLLYLHP